MRLHMAFDTKTLDVIEGILSSSASRENMVEVEHPAVSPPSAATLASPPYVLSPALPHPFGESRVHISPPTAVEPRRALHPLPGKAEPPFPR